MSDIITQTYPQIKFPTIDDFKNLPMAESPKHFKAINRIAYIVQEGLFQERKDVFVTGDTCVFYDKNNPTRCLIPDVMVVHGVKDKEKNMNKLSYKVWEEGNKYPDFIIEVTSPSTELKDREMAKTTYETIFKVSEYFMFDPNEGKLEGYRRIGNEYKSIERNDNARYASYQLGKNIELGVVERGIAIFKDGKRLLYYEEYGKVVKEKDKAIEEKDKAIEEKDKAIDKALKEKDKAIEQLKQEKIEIARSMMKKNIDISIVSEVTGLSKEEIERLSEP